MKPGTYLQVQLFKKKRERERAFLFCSTTIMIVSIFMIGTKI